MGRFFLKRKGAWHKESKKNTAANRGGVSVQQILRKQAQLEAISELASPLSVEAGQNSMDFNGSFSLGGGSGRYSSAFGSFDVSSRLEHMDRSVDRGPLSLNSFDSKWDDAPVKRTISFSSEVRVREFTSDTTELERRRTRAVSFF
mmetsp:Transcript_39913/g.97838  ORF Transcript_39913/g.97838 Transcript_39913/m.97838 type:complete len:146 (+) Transcript_39913:177-614(+)|eukprot:CAMPEP_0198366960 /NCGR_PEP_ID=MMETSP1450-20131203/154942_1 /TAXON_ID=753684 ORGANISM="Madagascaria erythrocladiodes, Strain CCMP3234" /NCGR_SAMPLE_ID=MMETSP1450 /ASSEMBLY_ACC=CAM_ASM_001115 /LENGTH=145 /DNA_ID=CAMNT_0044074429 /DNA_START=168 /DNA_END=605 /DNA_ORIENTATION=-